MGSHTLIRLYAYTNRMTAAVPDNTHLADSRA